MVLQDKPSLNISCKRSEIVMIDAEYKVEMEQFVFLRRSNNIFVLTLAIFYIYYTSAKLLHSFYTQSARPAALQVACAIYRRRIHATCVTCPRDTAEKERIYKSLIIT